MDKIRFTSEKKSASYADSFSTLWEGIRQLSGCLGATFALLVLDVVQFMVKHYIASVLVFVCFVSMFVTMTKARTERDHAKVMAYRYEQSCDSLRIIIGH